MFFSMPKFKFEIVLENEADFLKKQKFTASYNDDYLKLHNEA